MKQLEEHEETFDLVTKESLTLFAVVADRLGDKAFFKMLEEAKELVDKKWWSKQVKPKEEEK